MKTTEEQTVTVGEAARQLDSTVDALLELIYRNELGAFVQSESGRMLVSVTDVESLHGGSAL